MADRRTGSSVGVLDRVFLLSREPITVRGENRYRRHKDKSKKMLKSSDYVKWSGQREYFWPYPWLDKDADGEIGTSVELDVLPKTSELWDQTTPRGPQVLLKPERYREFLTGTRLEVNSLTGEVRNRESWMQIPCKCYWAKCPRHDHWVSAVEAFWHNYTDVVERRKRPVPYSTGTWKPVTHRSTTTEARDCSIHLDYSLEETVLDPGGEPAERIQFSDVRHIGVVPAVSEIAQKPEITQAQVQAAYDKIVPRIKAETELLVFLGELKDIKGLVHHVLPAAYRASKNLLKLARKLGEDPSVRSWKSLALRSGLTGQLQLPANRGVKSALFASASQLAKTNLWYQFGVRPFSSDMKKMMFDMLEIGAKTLKILQNRGQIFVTPAVVNSTDETLPYDIDLKTIGNLQFNELRDPSWSDLWLDTVWIYGQRDSLIRRIGDDGVLTAGSRRVVSTSTLSLMYKWDIYDQNGLPLTQEYAENLVFSDLLGINLDPSIVWELIPFSFVLDWFIGVGKWLESFERRNFNPSVTVYDAWLSHKVKISTIGYQLSRAEEQIDEDPDTGLPFRAQALRLSQEGFRNQGTYYERHRVILRDLDLVERIGDLEFRYPGMNQVGLGLSLLL